MVRSFGSCQFSNIIAHRISLPAPHDAVTIRILVSLPPSYPSTLPPQLQLLSKYIGPYGVDSGLFGSILRTFISVNGAEWSPDTVCVFDGLQSVVERCVVWYEDRLSTEQAGALIREDAKDHMDVPSSSSMDPVQEELIPNSHFSLIAAIPEGIQIVESEPIVDRKSTFVGRACQITHPSQVNSTSSGRPTQLTYLSQVPLVLSHLMSDRRISRAAHPTIHAYRCQVGTLQHQGTNPFLSSLGGLVHASSKTMMMTEKQLLEVALRIYCKYW